MTCLKLWGDLPFHNLDGPLLAAALLITLVWKHKKGKIFGRSVIILIIQGAEVSANTWSITMIIIHGAEESAAGCSVIMIYLIYCSGSRRPMPPTQSLRMTQVRMIAGWHLLVLRAPAHLWRPNMCWRPSEPGAVKRWTAHSWVSNFVCLKISLKSPAALENGPRHNDLFGLFSVRKCFKLSWRGGVVRCFEFAILCNLKKSSGSMLKMDKPFQKGRFYWREKQKNAELPIYPARRVPCLLSVISYWVFQRPCQTNQITTDMFILFSYVVQHYDWKTQSLDFIIYPVPSRAPCLLGFTGFFNAPLK